MTKAIICQHPADNALSDTLLRKCPDCGVECIGSVGDDGLCYADRCPLHVFVGQRDIDIDTFVTSYLETALWSSTDNSDDYGGKPLDDTYDIDDIAPESLAQAAKECADFCQLAGALLSGISDESAGHDFWLTRNGHGAGFWDRGYEGTIGQDLSKIAKTFGSCDVYVGDDGKLYMS